MIGVIHPYLTSFGITPCLTPFYMTDSEGIHTCLTPFDMTGGSDIPLSDPISASDIQLCLTPVSMTGCTHPYLTYFGMTPCLTSFSITGG